MTLFTTLCSGNFSVFSLHDFTMAFDNVDHFFLPKTLSFLYSITLLSLDSPLTYLIVLSNSPMILLFFCSQMLGIFKILFFAFFSFFLLSLYNQIHAYCLFYHLWSSTITPKSISLQRPVSWVSCWSIHLSKNMIYPLMCSSTPTHLYHFLTNTFYYGGL